MSQTPQIEIVGLSKRYTGLRPLRIAHMVVQTGDCLALSGFDAAAAELLVNLVTGAAVPDEGDVIVAGRNTRAISTDTEWLTSLDRFGIVTERSVLLEGLSVAANLALPLTLAIDPIAAEIRQQVEALAGEVGLGDRLDVMAGAMSAAERIRAHLARALALGPHLLLLEHPTARLDRAAADSFGEALKRVAARRRLGWLALTQDDEFAARAGGRRLRLDPVSGKLIEGTFWRRLVSTARG